MELLFYKQEKLHAAYHHHFNNITFTFRSDVRSLVDRIVQKQLQVDSAVRYNFVSMDYIALCTLILDYSDCKDLKILADVICCHVSMNASLFCISFSCA